MQEVIEKVFADVRRNFIYTPDGEQFNVKEDWRSYRDKIGEPWRDDCDGFALTCAELLVERGVAQDKVRLMLCKTETGVYHLVCGVDIEHDTLILDNRQRAILSWIAINYTWIKGSRVSEPTVWREI